MRKRAPSERAPGLKRSGLKRYTGYGEWIEGIRRGTVRCDERQAHETTRFLRPADSSVSSSFLTTSLSLFAFVACLGRSPHGSVIRRLGAIFLYERTLCLAHQPSDLLCLKSAIGPMHDRVLAIAIASLAAGLLLSAPAASAQTTGRLHRHPPDGPRLH